MEGRDWIAQMIEEQEAPESGGGPAMAFAALSNDSSCHHQLASARRGYETFVMEKGWLRLAQSE